MLFVTFMRCITYIITWQVLVCIYYIFNTTSTVAHVVNISFKKRCRPKRNFMDGQALINKGMRAILVDWLVEVAEEYNLVPETLFLTVNYIDRFLSSNAIVDPSKLQLVGVACMLIASKLEEIYPPEISEFVYITNSTYTGDEVRHSKVNFDKIINTDPNMSGLNRTRRN